MLTTLLAFLFALSVLIAGHEWGHYRVAVACGVEVLRFSIGFGPIIARWRPRRQHPGQDTEFVLSLVPLGGYVKMLDEREASVPPELRNRAFNNQPILRRALVVLAGPGANLVIAVLLYALVNWIGLQEPRAIVSAPAVGTLAERAGLHGGDLVLRGAQAGDALEPVASFESLRWLLTRAALDGRDISLEIAPAAAEGARRVLALPLASLQGREPNQELFREIGIVAPQTHAVIGELVAGGAAARAGLLGGDEVLRVDGVPISDGEQLRELIRESGRDGPPAVSAWSIRRDGRDLQITVQPDRLEDEGHFIGRIGAVVGAAPEMTLVRLGPVAGLRAGAVRTWEISVLSLKVLGRMVIGQVSLRNLSGPIMIADYAGKSIQLGFTYFLGFLAFISVSLGVLNLLPIPVLDGGHLMYYLWEAITGKPVDGMWLSRLQYLGLGVLAAFMSIALYNDLSNLLG